MSNYTFWALFGPASWMLWALAGCAVILTRGGRAAVSRARTLAVLAIALGLGVYVLPLGYYLIEPLESRFPLIVRSAVRATDIVVLAGGERLAPSYRHGRPEFGEHSERVFGAAMLAKRLPEARLWAVGGIRLWEDSPRDVDWMAAAWRDLGIAPERIGVVTGTMDTCENARGLARRLGAGRRVVLVTSAFHMPRSIACFRAAGIDPLPYPVDYQNGPRRGAGHYVNASLEDNFQRVDLALHEYVGLLYYRLQGRIADIWPGPTWSVADGAARPPAGARP